MVKRLVLALAAVATALLATGVAVADAKTFVVDKDLAQCPKADFVSIQAAVDAAAPGDTIKVCPDLYTEGVFVDKTLTLEGETGATKPEHCFEPTPPDPTRDAIVVGVENSFILQADDIVLRRFVIQGTLRGIFTGAAFSGYRIRDNVVQPPTIGLEFNSSGVHESRAEHNCFRHINVATSEFPGAGAITATPTLANARIEHNDFFDNGGAIGADATGPDVTVAHNTSVADVVFVGLQNTTGIAIHHNIATDNLFAILASGSTGVTISHNDFRDAIIGMQLGFEPPNVGFVVSYNRVSGMTSIGINAIDVDRSLFSNNVLDGNGSHGLNLGVASTENQVEYNRADSNGEDGVRNSGADNTFLRNHMHDNVEHDGHDDDRPANTWIGNKCETDSPPGTICE